MSDLKAVDDILDAGLPRRRFADEPGPRYPSRSQLLAKSADQLGLHDIARCLVRRRAGPDKRRALETFSLPPVRPHIVVRMPETEPYKRVILAEPDLARFRVLSSQVIGDFGAGGERVVVNHSARHIIVVNEHREIINLFAANSVTRYNVIC